MYLIILIHLTQCRTTSYLARFELPGWEVWMVWRVAEPLSLKAEARILSIGPGIGRCRYHMLIMIDEKFWQLLQVEIQRIRKIPAATSN